VCECSCRCECVCGCGCGCVRERERERYDVKHCSIYKHITELCQTKPFSANICSIVKRTQNGAGNPKNLHLQYCQIISLFFLPG
jgi:hypothetical protein